MNHELKQDKNLWKLANTYKKRFLTAILLYAFAGVAVYLFAKMVYYNFTFQETNVLYRIANYLQARIEIVEVFYVAVGGILIAFYFQNKVLLYLSAVVKGTEKINSESRELITLPPELNEIEKKMNQTKVDLRESRRAAKEAEQRKNDLVVYLAHDLKTPLTSVIGYLTLLRDEGRISEELREHYLSVALDKAQRLEDLINEFFEITRFSLTALTLEICRVNLTRMLEQLIFEFKPMLAEKNLECTLEAQQDIMIKCDVDKMQRVFDNLLRNALNYSFDESRIEITVKQEKSNLTISFFNHGNTIPQEKLGRIFEQFFRLDTARATGSGGAGLGLAIAKEIVELHGGSIRAESKDETVRFELTIPVS